ncbi:MAG: biopolymer transporter TolR [Rhodothermales bacterium]|nr:biopolymer transporter TolR [Rhodothermales bacterium]
MRVSRLCLVVMLSIAACAGPDLGMFDGQSDVGAVKIAGAVDFDEAAGAYTLVGGGTDLWADNDEFLFLWKKIPIGDLTLAADIEIVGDTGNPHRKAVVMVRQDLDQNSAYASAALHANGLTALQHRPTKGGLTSEVIANIRGPRRLQIAREGDVLYMAFVAGEEPLQPAGGSFKIPFVDSVYVGFGVSSHNNDTTQTAVFRNVALNTTLPPAAGEPRIESTLEIIPIAAYTDRRVVYRAMERFEAPNWSPDGSYLLFNMNGGLYTIPPTGGEPTQIVLDPPIRANNDHGITPDGQTLIISGVGPGHESSKIYTSPIAGGTPKLITPLEPSYWHGVSPDGQTHVYCALRNGNYDVYSMPIGGGRERRLTTADGLDDGPEYSPDGQWIYFNSVRTGTMQIYRMRPDGSDQQQLTFDDYNDWFPHISPDGRNMVFVSFEPGVEGHPAYHDVLLRMMPAEGGEPVTIAKLFGGQGTINVNSWSPDSKEFAFVSHRQVRR